MITNKPDTITSQDVVPSLVADHEFTSACLNISKPKKTARVSNVSVPQEL